jgi:hypothetical protein
VASGPDAVSLAGALEAAPASWTAVVLYRFGRLPAALGLIEQNVAGTWATHFHPPTQLPGRVAHDSARVVGIKYASAKHPDGLNLVAFPDRIPAAAGSSLQVYDPLGNLAQRLGP